MGDNMDKLSMDTDQLKTQGEELKSIANDLTNLLNEMYGKLTNVDNNGIWSSESLNGSANTFIANVKKDHINNKALCTNISNIGDAIIQYSSDIKTSSESSVGE